MRDTDGPFGTAVDDPALLEQLAHDELADLYLGAAPARSNRPEQNIVRPIEIVLTPRLGPRAPDVIRRYAAGVAEERGKPTLVVYLGSLTVSVECVEVDAGARSVRRHRSMAAVLGELSDYGAVLIHPEHDGRSVEGGRLADAVAVLFKPDADSTAWAYRTISRARDDLGPSPALRAGPFAAWMGTPEGEAAFEELQDLASARLGERIEIAHSADRCVWGLVYRGLGSLELGRLIAALREKESAEPREDDGARVAPSLIEAKPAAGDVAPLGIEGLHDVGFRCPDADEIEVAIDSAGRVHLVARGIEMLAPLLAAEAWATSNAELLERLEGVTDAEEPGLHLIARDARSVASLMRTYIRLYLVGETAIDALN